MSPPACARCTAAPRFLGPQCCDLRVLRRHRSASGQRPTYVMHAVLGVLAHSVPNRRAVWSGRIQAESRLARSLPRMQYGASRPLWVRESRGNSIRNSIGVLSLAVVTPHNADHRSIAPLSASIRGRDLAGCTVVRGAPVPASRPAVSCAPPTSFQISCMSCLLHAHEISSMLRAQKHEGPQRGGKGLSRSPRQRLRWIRRTRQR